MAINGWRPALDNELVGVHWAIAARRKRRDAEMLGKAALVFGVPRATGRRRLSVMIWGRYHKGAVPDDPAVLKSLQDALVTAGLLVDDSHEFLELDWPPRYLRGPRSTMITLEDIES